MIDYHIHPDYSIDAEPFTMNQYCEKAVAIGLTHICFTSHCEFDETRSEKDWFVRCRGEIVKMHPAKWLESYFEDAYKCRHIYSSYGLDVRIGIEAGYDLGLEEKIKKLLDEYPFDFVIGSVHCLDRIAISSQHESPEYYSVRTLEQAARAYYTTLAEAVKTSLFDVIGHVDIYRRHGTAAYGQQVDEIYREYIPKILQLMQHSGTGIELNTSSLSSGQGSFYPGIGIINEAVKLGIKYFTVGSDCHRIDELGRGVNEAIQQGEALGIKFSVYEKRKPKLLEPKVLNGEF